MAKPRPSKSAMEPLQSLQPLSMDERRKAVRRFRKQLKLSQTELATLAGLDHSMLSRFEKGQRDLSPAAFERLERALGAALGRRDADAATAAQDASRIALSPEAVAQIRAEANRRLSEVPNASQQPLGGIADGTAAFETYMRLLGVQPPPQTEHLGQVQLLEELVSAQKQQLRIDQELIAAYRDLVGELKGATKDKEQKIAALEQRVALLSDLLNVRTTESLAVAEAKELEAKLHEG